MQGLGIDTIVQGLNLKVTSTMGFFGGGDKNSKGFSP